MKLGLHLGYWGAKPVDAVPLAREAERLGFDSVWTAEAWGSDAVTPLTWVAAKTDRIGVGTAIMQIAARTPAATAMTAITLDHLSGGRLRLGLGVSGPQVVEGWHGVPYGEPLRRTREYVEIVRAIIRRDRPVEYHGSAYHIPVRGGTGLGKPLRTIVHPLRPDPPILLAAIGPRNVALAGEIADGWLPILAAPRWLGELRGNLAEGFARAGRSGAGFEIAPSVNVVVGADLDACRDAVRPFVALYVGGMGAKGQNFYHAVVRRFGYEDEANEIQEHYLEGRRHEAAVAVPDSLVDEVALVGPPDRIQEGLAAWRNAGATLLIAQTRQLETLRVLASAVPS